MIDIRDDDLVDLEYSGGAGSVAGCPVVCSTTNPFQA